MTAPERIYLQDAGDYDGASEVTWCADPQDPADTAYIRADLAQPAQVQTDHRDEVIARLVEALEWQRDQPEAHPFMKLQADTALAAAKAVQK